MSARDDNLSSVGPQQSQSSHLHSHSQSDYDLKSGLGSARSAGSGSGSAGGGGGGSVRKRASRAGTRSVSTLSPAQLERKRANDREAQRAIRQRTKEHIEKLEKRILDLSSNDERNTQLLAALKRNKELEEENAMLKASLQQANYALGVSDQSQNWQQVPHLKTPIPGQSSMRMTSQQDMRPSAVSPGSAISRNDSSAFPQSSGWQSAAGSYGNSPMSARGFGSASNQGGMRSADPSQDPNQQWRYGRGRAQTTPLGDDQYGNKSMQTAMPGAQHQQQAPQQQAQQQQQQPPPQQQQQQQQPQQQQQQHTPQQQQQQQIDYSYPMPAPQSNQAPVGRANSQPHLFHPSEAEQHDQHMRHLSEQLGLSPVETRYGQPSMMQPQGTRHSLPGMAAQQSSASYQAHSGGPLKASADSSSQQQQQPMYYAPYSR